MFAFMLVVALFRLCARGICTCAFDCFALVVAQASTLWRSFEIRNVRLAKLVVIHNTIVLCCVNIHAQCRVDIHAHCHHSSMRKLEVR